MKWDFFLTLQCLETIVISASLQYMENLRPLISKCNKNVSLETTFLYILIKQSNDGQNWNNASRQEF